MAFGTNKKILIVDDAPTIRKIVIQMLLKRGCTNFIEAENGEQAWRLLEKSHKDGKPVEFVMSDWNMPILSGLNLVKDMKADPRFRQIPFLMISAEGDKESVITAYKAGITDFVVKPFSTKLLGQKIDEIFAA